GYLNNPEKTADSFIFLTPHKHTTQEAVRFYKSGDLACWLPDGNIKFLGRLDNQVNIRGYRIELGEIENRLHNHPSIKDAVVTVGSDSDPHLRAYIVWETPEPVEAAICRDYLAEVLPAYMIPRFFIPLEKIPLTQNGKIDTAALPEPDLMTGQDYIPPQNHTEETLAQLWAPILEIDSDLIGREADFFDLGGHSLRAGTLTTRIHKELGVAVPLAEIFKSPTLKAMADYISSTGPKTYTGIPQAEEREYYPLSPSQQRFYMMQQLVPTGTPLNMPLVMDIEGELDIDRVENVFKQLIRRHESLRTSFLWAESQPMQYVHREPDFRLEELNPEAVDAFIRPFDLTQAPLLRVGIHREEAGKYLMVLDMHHIITDGTSMEIFVKEFAALYKGETLPPQSIQFKDFSQWRARRLKEPDILAQRSFLRSQLEGELPVLDLPLDFPRPVVQDFDGDAVEFYLSADIIDSLQAVTAETGCTLYMVLLAALTILMGRYSRQNDILVGTPVAGRNRAELENTIGFFLETIVVRNQLQPHGAPPRGKNGRQSPGKPTTTQFLNMVKENTLKAFDNQDYPFSQLIKELEQVNENDLSRNPLFDVMLNLLNLEPGGMEIPGLRVTRRPIQSGGAKVDLTMDVWEVREPASAKGPKTDSRETHTPGDTIAPGAPDDDKQALTNSYKKGVKITLGYGTALFRRETIERMAGHFINILRQLVTRRDLPLCRIEMTSEPERRQILENFNHAPAPLPDLHRPVHVWFSQQARRTPDAIALVGKSRMSYLMLDRHSDNLASTLVEQKGVRPNDIVATTINGCIEMIVVLLGILKAGAAYLPINPDTPKERIAYILKDSNAACCLNNENRQLVPGYFHEGAAGVGKASPWPSESLPASPSRGRRRHEPPSNNEIKPAYVIYTSGSTGRPKDELVSHRNLNSYIHSFFHEFKLTAKDTVIQQASFAFDAFVEEMYPILLCGGKLAVPPAKTIMDIHLLAHYISRMQITMITCSPLLLEQLNRLTSTLPGRIIPATQGGINPGTQGEGHETAQEDNPDLLRSMRIFISGGDVLKREHISSLLSIGDVYNTYGPTEATVCATYYKCPQDVPHDIPIGKPILNGCVFILDENQQLQPVGVPGELCISGHGVTSGYLNQPELAARQFRPGTGNRGPGKHTGYIEENDRKCTPPLYHSGDLACWLPDGSIRFIGRIDRQVKIRGYRIELGEIENRLAGHPQVKNAAVIDTEVSAGNRLLIAYVEPHKANPHDDGKRKLHSMEKGTRHHVEKDLLGHVEKGIPNNSTTHANDTRDTDNTAVKKWKTDFSRKLKEWLANILPHYMVPSIILILDSIPVTAAGKPDRRALPRMEASSTRNEYVAPQSDVEKQLVNIWEELLGKKDIGIDDNFFEMGGQSILAMRAVADVNESLGVQLPIADFFETGTIRRIASRISTTKAKDTDAEVKELPKAMGGKKIKRIKRTKIEL
ncbi:MAG: AMP-binding protein, partial [bacterium]|nr:AMP-binding protein [bacterium]